MQCVQVQAEQPTARINIFSIDKVRSVEPHIAIDLDPGEEKRWRHAYSFTAP